jgi:hypothetical protein
MTASGAPVDTTAAPTPPAQQAHGPVPAAKTATPEEAALLALSPLSPTNTFEIRPEYTTIRPNANVGSVDMRLALWMPFVLIPGIQAPRMGSLFFIDLQFDSAHAPMVHETGIEDISLIDATVYQFRHVGIGVGFTALLPSATSPLFGRGKLQLGPTSVFAVGGHRLLFTLTLINLFSVAGAPDRPDVDRLVAVPNFGCLLPKAFFLRFDPIWTFDWKRSGFATIPVNLAAGHAFTKHLLLFIQPEWVTTGTFKNSFTMRVGVTYLGW